MDEVSRLKKIIENRESTNVIKKIHDDKTHRFHEKYAL